jgi:TetR/AcrR family transcriptional repressor of nem operon
VPSSQKITRPPKKEGDTASRILDVAERLAQTRGFNGFSYADIAAELHITKASLHYHFPGKAELGKALVDRYSRRFAEALAAIDARLTCPRDRLQAYADIYADVISAERMCLCGTLAAEYRTLPEPMQQALIRFFDENEAWLTGVLEQGRADRSLAFAGPPGEAARLIVSGLEGAMLVARPYDDAGRFRAAADRLLASIVTPA